MTRVFLNIWCATIVSRPLLSGKSFVPSVPGLVLWSIENECLHTRTVFIFANN